MPEGALRVLGRRGFNRQQIGPVFFITLLEDNNHNLALTFVEIDNDEPATKNVAGFFTLRAHAVRITDIDTENGTGDTKEVPLAELMCLARDERWKQRGIGDALMIDALSIIAKASECIGFIGVHLRSTEHGTKLYERYDFQEFKAHPQRDKMRYILSVKTIKEIVSLLP